MENPTPLLTRARKLAGPDRGIDAAIHGAAFGGDQWAALIVPEYTASLDAIVGLIEAKLPGWTWRVYTERNASFDAVSTCRGDGPGLGRSAGGLRPVVRWTCTNSRPRPHSRLPRRPQPPGDDTMSETAKAGWQLIETAPRNGDWVELCERVRPDPDNDGSIWWSRPIVGRWYAEDGEGFWCWPDDTYEIYSARGRRSADAAVENGDCFEDDKFTHWRPLTPAPEAAP